MTDIQLNTVALTPSRECLVVISSVRALSPQAAFLWAWRWARKWTYQNSIITILVPAHPVAATMAVGTVALGVQLGSAARKADTTHDYFAPACIIRSQVILLRLRLLPKRFLIST